jgi:hypothetical protein
MTTLDCRCDDRLKPSAGQLPITARPQSRRQKRAPTSQVHGSLARDRRSCDRSSVRHPRPSATSVAVPPRPEHARWSKRDQCAPHCSARCSTRPRCESARDAASTAAPRHDHQREADSPDATAADHQRPGHHQPGRSRRSATTARIPATPTRPAPQPAHNRAATTIPTRAPRPTRPHRQPANADNESADPETTPTRPPTRQASPTHQASPTPQTPEPTSDPPAQLPPNPPGRPRSYRLPTSAALGPPVQRPTRICPASVVVV